MSPVSVAQRTQLRLHLSEIFFGRGGAEVHSNTKIRGTIRLLEKRSQKLSISQILN